MPKPPMCLTVEFDPALTPEQCTKALAALADYWRACGGTGFKIEPTVEDLEPQPMRSCADTHGRKLNWCILVYQPPWSLGAKFTCPQCSTSYTAISSASGSRWLVELTK